MKDLKEEEGALERGFASIGIRAEQVRKILV